MEAAAGRIGWVRNVALGMLVVALIAGIVLPLYTDEVGWRLQERAALDGVDKLFTDLCGPNTLARPPFWMMPARWYSALFNTLFADPLYVRISGILYALAWLALLLRLIGRMVGTARDAAVLAVLAIGFLSLGTLPLLLVWSRPEQPIMLAFTGAMLVASGDWARGDPETDARTAWLRSLSILALACVALSYHLKAVFTVPVLLACLFFASRGRAAHLPRLVTGLVLAGITAWAAHYWIHRLECPAEATVAADFARNNTGAALVSARGWDQIVPLIGKLLGNISLFEYLGIPAPRYEPMSAWLPLHRIGEGPSFTFFLAIVLAWSAALVFAGASLVAAARRAWRERRLEPRIALALALVATVLGWSATQNIRNVYEATFVVPMMVLAVTLILSSETGDRRPARRMAPVAIGVGAMGVVSVALVAGIYGPALARIPAERGYVAGQPYSISPFGYAGMRRDIAGAAAKCGIGDPARHRALMVDDVTYFAFMRSRLPDHSGGLFSPIVTPRDPLDYLRSVKSEGMIVSCSELPADLRARAKRQGRFCCLGPPGW